jgi:hypothetical protein
MRPKTFCLETTYSSQNLKASFLGGRKPILWSLDINPGRPPRLPNMKSVFTKHHSTIRSVSSYASTLSSRKNSEARPPTSAQDLVWVLEGPDDAGRKYVRLCQLNLDSPAAYTLCTIQTVNDYQSTSLFAYIIQHFLKKLHCQLPQVPINALIRKFWTRKGCNPSSLFTIVLLITLFPLILLGPDHQLWLYQPIKVFLTQRLQLHC